MFRDITKLHLNHFLTSNQEENELINPNLKKTIMKEEMEEVDELANFLFENPMKIIFIAQIKVDFLRKQTVTIWIKKNSKGGVLQLLCFLKTLTYEFGFK